MYDTQKGSTLFQKRLENHITQIYLCAYHASSIVFFDTIKHTNIIPFFLGKLHVIPLKSNI